MEAAEVLTVDQSDENVVEGERHQGGRRRWAADGDGAIDALPHALQQRGSGIEPRPIHWTLDTYVRADGIV